MTTTFNIEQGLRLPRSPWDTIAVVGLAAKGDGNPTLIGSLTEAIEKYGERLSIGTGTGKTINDYGLVDAIETIYKYIQVPIIAVNAAPGAVASAVAAKSYTFDALEKINLDDPNIVAPVVVTNVGATVTYTFPADYMIDALTGEITRTAASSIPALGTVRVNYSVVNFAGSIDWIAAIGRVVPVLNRNPTLIVTAGVEVSSAIALALDARAIALGSIAVYTQPGVSATAAVPLVNSSTTVAVYPIRTSERGVEESGVHAAAAIALLNYWESPDGDPLKESAVALTLADSALLVAKGISWGSDRIMNAIATNGVPLNVARLRAKAQFLANRVAVDWKNKPFDLVHLEGIGQAIRDSLNREPEASLLPYSVVNYNAQKSSTTLRRLVFDIILTGDDGGDQIAEITIFVS
jgi:hypothetical protein